MTKAITMYNGYNEARILMSEKNNGFTTIRISKETHELIGSLCPKRWDYDRFIAEIAKYWKDNIGKHPKDNITNRIDA